MSKKPKKQVQPSKPKRRSHHPTIRETESPVPLELASEESTFWEDISKAVPPIPFEEIGWIGGRAADEPGMAAKVDKLIQGDLTFYSALELIMLGIIRAHPIKVTSAKATNNATEQRLKAVVRDLTGKKPKKGQVHRSDTEWVCTAAAFHYVRQATNFDQQAEAEHLYAILKIILSARLKGKTQKQQDDTIRPYVNFFLTHKLRLLMKVTWSCSEEQKTRRAHIYRIVDSLKALSIQVDIDSVKEQLEIPSLESTV